MLGPIDQVDPAAVGTDEKKVASTPGRTTRTGSGTTPTRLLIINFTVTAACYAKQIKKPYT
ncbi:hypothetical protein [Streptomyces spinosirectus]